MPRRVLKGSNASVSHQLTSSHQILLILFPKHRLICPLPPPTMSLLSTGLVTSHTQTTATDFYMVVQFQPCFLFYSIFQNHCQAISLRHKSGHITLLLKTLPWLPSTDRQQRLQNSLGPIKQAYRQLSYQAPVCNLWPTRKSPRALVPEALPDLVWTSFLQPNSVPTPSTHSPYSSLSKTR